ncbi:Dehydrogenase, E1 component [Sesbania bispinosa]|nr:Dehydrogenase, E1 component [Sesbania bispinosa]
MEKETFNRMFCYLYDGQEVVAVGLEVAIIAKNCVFTAYHDHRTILCHDGTLVASS